MLSLWCCLIRVVRKDPTEKEQFEQTPTALSHADMVGDGAKGLQVEGTATAKTLKWEHTLFFRDYQEGHSASLSIYCISGPNPPFSACSVARLKILLPSGMMLRFVSSGC